MQAGEPRADAHAVPPRIAPLPRLAAIRAALLAAPHEVCTQQAELLTEYFRRAAPGRIPALVTRPHYRRYVASLGDQARGVRAPRWKLRLDRALRRVYQWIDGADPDATVLAYARGLEHVLARMPLRVYDHELIVGNLSGARLGAPLHADYAGLLMAPELDGLARRADDPFAISDAQRRALREDVFPYWFRRSVLGLAPLIVRDVALVDRVVEGTGFVLTQLAGIAHVTPDYPSVLRLGFTGIAARIRARRVEVLRERPSAGRRARLAFLEAALIATRAAIAYGHRWRAALLAEAARAGSATRRDELTGLADVLARVPARPARTFHEALQAVFTAHVIVHQESFQHGVSFGRMDQYLWPYYRRDLAAGRLTPARAVELLGCFLAKAAEQLPLFFGRATDFFSGLSSASGITLGGQHADGADAVNPVSYLVLEAYDQLRLRQPNLHARFHDGTPDAFRARCYQILGRGAGIPALFHDAPIIAAQRAAGVPIADARDYAIVGCAEWGVPYRSFPAAGAAFVNLAYALSLALHGGRDGGAQRGPRTRPPSAWRGIDDAYAAFRAQLDALVAGATAGNDAIEVAHARHRPTPLLSTIVGGCIAVARDVTAGGAVYDTTGVQGVGLADVADSLTAIELAVFRERRVTMSELVAACDADFAGREALHAYLVSRVPGYGEDDDTADVHAARVSALFAELVSARRNPRGGAYAPGMWSMTTHQAFGRAVGALPSGRRAGQPLANGISPRLGRERRGPTAALASAARVARLRNGCVLNHELHPSVGAGARGLQLMDGLVRGYFARGGMQVQIAVQDPAVLVDAKHHPERHRDLVVRISGYSAYFNDLTEAMKDELIARTAHAGAGACP